MHDCFLLVGIEKKTFIVQTYWQDSTTSVEGDMGSTWSSGRQMSIREWDIPLEELKVAYNRLCL